MTLDDLANNVLLDVPDCPLMTIRQEVARSARDFCTKADAWVERGKLCVVMVSALDGKVTPPLYGEPIRLVGLTVGGRRTVQGEGWLQVDAYSVEFDREPAQNTFEGDLAMRPHPGKLPIEEVVDRWSEAFEDGARARLLLMPQPWRDPAMAEFYRLRYEAAISEAKTNSRFGHGRGKTRVQPRRFN